MRLKLALGIGLLGAAVTALVIAIAGADNHSHQAFLRPPVRQFVPAAPPVALLKRLATPVKHVTPRQSLSLTQLAGQRIIYAYAGLTPPRSLLTHIRRGEAAGVIFFQPNISSPEQLRSVVGQLQRANASSPVHAPLLMMTDQEGGLVRRLPGAPEQSEKQLGESEDSPNRVRQAGQATAENLAQAGLNVNLAPVLDVYRERGNFIDQFGRSYGREPHRVARLGQAFIASQQQTGVAASAKHFPGLGAATRIQNTDEAPVILNLSLAQLRKVDEAPYRAAIAAHVRLVMLSWAIYPALDPTLPAGLSPRVVEGELRHGLGFDGVTVTDSIGAGALESFGGPAQRAVLAAKAGTDLVLCSARELSANTPMIGVAALNGIASAIRDHQLNRSRTEQAAAQVIGLRSHV